MKDGYLFHPPSIVFCFILHTSSFILNFWHGHGHGFWHGHGTFMRNIFFPLSIIGILCWWYAAFKAPATVLQHTNFETHRQAPQLPLFSSLTSLRRDDLQKALAGNSVLMTKMISDWDVDAQLIEDAGYQNVKRLPGKSYLRSQVLGRILAQNKPHRLKKLREQMRLKTVIDDAGKALDFPLPPKRFLPQTYVSASFLLALGDPEQVVALPRGLREQKHLFPKELTNQISYDLDRYNSEKLYLANPDVAFIAYYSHPALVDALRNQGIKLFSINKLDTFEDINSALLRVGHVINRPMEAELLSIFMEAAMLAIDNRMMALKEAQNAAAKVLFVNYHAQFSVPGSQTLTGQLLTRAGISHILEDNQHSWTIPIAQEYIVNFNPDCLIVATVHRKEVEAQIQHDLAFSSLPAVQNQRVVFVDDTVQQFSSQHIVLAYYDLFQAITCL
jgi:iron complex transport system substrate-binding protein